MTNHTLSWRQLFAKLRPILSADNAAQPDIVSNNKHTIMKLLKQYKSQEDDFKQYLFYDQSGYTKNLVEEFSRQCNVIIMCWAPGQASAFHGHEGSRCFVKVLAGTLTEQQVSYPSGNNSISAIKKEQLLTRGQVCYIDDSIGIHKVINGREPAVSLHIYLPAYTKCRIFDDSQATLKQINQQQSPLSKVIDVDFHSRLGDETRSRPQLIQQ